jgi:integrase
VPAPSFQSRTEKAYRFWVRQFILFHNKRHPRDMGPGEVEALLNHLAVHRRVAASTQSQALHAVVFLYDSVLGHPLGQMTGLKRVQRRQRVPVVLTREEVKAALALMEGTCRLMAELMYVKTVIESQWIDKIPKTRLALVGRLAVRPQSLQVRRAAHAYQLRRKSTQLL